MSRRNRWGCTSSPYTARTKRTSPRCPCHTPPHPQKSSSLVEQSAPNSTQLHPAHLLLAVCSNELPFLPPCQSTAAQLWQQQSQNSCCRCKIPRRQAWCTNINLHRPPAILFPLHFHFCTSTWLIKLLSQCTCTQSAVQTNKKMKISSCQLSPNTPSNRMLTEGRKKWDRWCIR